MTEVMEEAPGELETVRLFVNTLHDHLSTDEIATPEALHAWLADHRLTDSKVAVGPADLRRAVAVREALRRLMLSNNGEPLDEEAVRTVNAAAARARVAPSLDDHASWSLQAAGSGVDAALGELLALVFESMSEGSWERLKACGDPGCAYAFYDHSKNRSGRWCDMASCGNRMKARAFRERERAERAKKSRRQ
jgi:predicted RNA-binding Zn ribbon-like protein